VEEGERWEKEERRRRREKGKKEKKMEKKRIERKRERCGGGRGDDCGTGRARAAGGWPLARCVALAGSHAHTE
jgi:hypothetical protein